MPRRLRVVLRPPGRFPTTVPDIGGWWDGRGIAFDLNRHWWSGIASRDAGAIARPSRSLAVALRQRVELGAQGISPGGLARQAALGLAALGELASFRDRRRYLGAIGAVLDQVALLNRLQDEFMVSLGSGPAARGVDYGSSRSLMDFASHDSLLAATIREALGDFPDQASFVAFRTTSPQDLLTALITARLLRRLAPAAHLCLADHGYENYSLQPYLRTLKAEGAFLAFFDTIVEAKRDRDGVVAALSAAVDRGERPRGYFGSHDVAGSGPDDGAPSFPGVRGRFESFTPAPVYWLRLSDNRCYWNRCTFCTQNSKHVGLRAPEKSEITGALGRIQGLLEGGIEDFIFSDEALSPALLRALGQEIIARGLRLRWSCRSKLELAHDRDLFILLKQAGCQEILFGLETTSLRLQERMGKAARGVDVPFLRGLFRHMAEVGIAPHVNLMVGFPGDTPGEARASVEFTAEVLAGSIHGSYTLNRFVLYPDTEILARPADFGMQVLPWSGDMPSAHDYALEPALAGPAGDAVAQMPEFERTLRSACGLGDLPGDEVGEAVAGLYLDSGHGAVIKREAVMFSRPVTPCASS